MTTDFTARYILSCNFTTFVQINCYFATFVKINATFLFFFVRQELALIIMHDLSIGIFTHSATQKNFQPFTASNLFWEQLLQSSPQVRISCSVQPVLNGELKNTENRINRPGSSVVKRTLSVQKVWGSIPRPVKSTQWFGSPPLATLLRSCVAQALSRRDGSRHS